MESRGKRILQLLKRQEEAERNKENNVEQQGEKALSSCKMYGDIESDDEIIDDSDADADYCPDSDLSESAMDIGRPFCNRNNMSITDQIPYCSTSEEIRETIIDDELVTGEVSEEKQLNQFGSETPTNVQLQIDSDNRLLEEESTSSEVIKDQRRTKNKSQIKQRGKKRVIHSDEWQCNVRKFRRAAGMSYTSKKGKDIPARHIKAPCNCRMKCFEKIAESDRLDVFNSYWSADMDNDKKRQFLVTCVDTKPTATTRKNATKPKSNSLTYGFIIKNKSVKICKIMFLNTLAISNTTVNTALKKRKTGGIVEQDKRGRHEPTIKTRQEIIDSVIRHISSIPHYESHYSSERSKRKFLSPDLNLEKMYKLYLEHCSENNIEPSNRAKKWLYGDIFNKQFNLSFKPVKNDTCDTCDQLKCQIKRDALSETAKSDIQKKYRDHLADADARYRMKTTETTAAKRNSTYRVLTVDLQKCLPTPMLTCGLSFYKRKLWTFNFTMYDSFDGSSYCMMWDETKAGRGGEEMASAILKWTEAVIPGSDIKEITIWSDNCYGQNKNTTLVGCYFWILHKWPQIEKINHKYLLKGHTHMEADTVHALIERKRKTVDNVSLMTPWDWQQFIRLCSPKIHVYNMELQDFKNFKSLYKGSQSPFVNRRNLGVNEIPPKTKRKEEPKEIGAAEENGKNQFSISQCVHLQCCQNSIGSIFYKTSFDAKEFTQLNLKRRNGQFPDSIQAIRSSSKPISVQKYNDLLALLQFIPAECHGFYKDIGRDDNVADFPDSEDDDE